MVTLRRVLVTVEKGKCHHPKQPSPPTADPQRRPSTLYADRMLLAGILSTALTLLAVTCLWAATRTGHHRPRTQRRWAAE